ncbi:MAG: ankyrin repeat domain-containing protein [Rickettsiales bacterium]|nr:ankyrin repeat domain-containing protein [Rickettsiales bacterium]
MEYKQWKEILSAVSKETDLSRDNVIEKIKEKLKAENGEDEYKKWEEAGFDVNHLFEGKDDKLTLLHLAASRGYAKIVNLLIENDASVDVAANR